MITDEQRVEQALLMQTSRPHKLRVILPPEIHDELQKLTRRLRKKNGTRISIEEVLAAITKLGMVGYKEATNEQIGLDPAVIRAGQVRFARLARVALLSGTILKGWNGWTGTLPKEIRPQTAHKGLSQLFSFRTEDHRRVDHAIDDLLYHTLVFYTEWFLEHVNGRFLDLLWPQMLSFPTIAEQRAIAKRYANFQPGLRILRAYMHEFDMFFPGIGRIKAGRLTTNPLWIRAWQEKSSQTPNPPSSLPGTERTQALEALIHRNG